MEYLLEKMSSSDKDAKPIQLHLLKTITEDFSEKMKVGSGVYGEVYKGVLNGDEVAVKKFFPGPGLDDEAFENEFRNLKKVQHKNGIRMIGYCYEIAHRDVEYQGQLVWSLVIDRALCFEYMKGGSLANYISDESCMLDWLTTYKIINGICEGLHYLHKGQEQMIFHLDLKPGKVLLDENFVPKIGGFGLSKLFGTSYAHQISTMKGTIGFMPQEYINHRLVSPKHDVFSLGVIIFHMMAGAKGYGNYWDALHCPNFSPKIQQDFVESVQEHWKIKMDETEGYRWDETDLLGVTKCIETAMRCVEDDRDNRPSITEIIVELKQLNSKIEEMLKEDPKPLTRQLGIWFASATNHQVITQRSELELMLFDESTEAKPISLSFLEHITSGFSNDNEIGYGGFARVYKGILENGKVAVKKLSRTFDIDEKTYEEELLCLTKTKHKNIVRFLGYCSDTQRHIVDYEGNNVLADVRQRLLCFEYLPNGSLDKKITDPSRGLEWRKRYQIINGICDGLYYLHQKRIVHLDLKPANILLDDNMMPKIADFGLSRCFSETQSWTITSKLIGTLGYLAPEWYGCKKITFKLDIYSLGIIIIDILTGEKGYPDIENVLESWRNRLEKSQEETQLVQIRVCAQIAIECVDFNPEKRPNIQYIIDKFRATKNAVDFATETGVGSSEVASFAP